jgi:CO dehydrogenase/acetyl-CoA synthase beta subunit
MAPNGIGFSTMAGQTGGGKQIVGFLGIGVNYFYSPKFIQADGGWNRVVWLPSMLKEKIAETIPPEIIDKIATEKDAADIQSLKAFLQEKNHPVVATWAAAEEEEEGEEEEEVAVTAAPVMMPSAGYQMPAMASMPMAMPMMSAGKTGGIKITFKKAKISIERMVISEKK